MTTADPCFAVSGATGAVGRAVLEALAVARPASRRVLALASAESVDDTVGFGRHELSVLDTATQDPAAIDILFHAGAAGADALAQAVADAGKTVIDLGGRLHGDTVRHCPHPLALMIGQLLDALPAGIERLTMTAMLPVVSYGRRGVDELAQQTTALFNQRGYDTEVLPRQVAFNLLAQVGEWADDGATELEARVLRDLDALHPVAAVSLTAALVPVFFGHAVSLEAQGATAFDRGMLVTGLKAAGIDVHDDGPASAAPSPMDVLGQTRLQVSRVRVQDNRVALWLTTDGLRLLAAHAIGQAL